MTTPISQPCQPATMTTEPCKNSILDQQNMQNRKSPPISGNSSMHEVGVYQDKLLSGSLQAVKGYAV